jgi:hypothetical protein
MKKLGLLLVAGLVLTGCNAPSAPTSGNHKSQTLSDISKVDFMTLFRVEYHVGDVINVKGNEGMRTIGNLR